MKPYLLSLLILAGCTSIKTTQVETDGKTSKTTTVSITSFADSTAKVNKLRTTATDKTQGMSLGEASTEASSSNVINVISAMTEVAIRAMK